MRQDQVMSLLQVRLFRGGGNNIYEMNYSGILLGTPIVFITGSSATDLIQTYSSIPHKTKRLEKNEDLTGATTKARI